MLIAMKTTHPLHDFASPKLVPSTVGALLMVALQAHAGILGTPLSLTLSQTFIHDSNFERLENGRGDTVSTTEVKVGLDKNYGRQSYQADVAVNTTRFQKLSQYNNNGFDLSLKFNSDVASASRISVNHARSRSLQEFDVQGIDDRRKEVTTYISTSLEVQHGLYSRWYLIGSLDVSKADYESSQANARSSKGGRVGVRFSPTDLLIFEMGLRKTTTDYPYSTLFDSAGNAKIGDEISRVDLDFQSGLVLTGYSKLRAQVNWTQETHDSVDTARDFNGLTGSLAWDFTPHGKVGYSLKFSRDTNDGGGFSSASRTSIRNKLITNLGATASWSASSKLNVSGGVDWQHMKEDELQFSSISGASAQDSASGVRRQLRLNAVYEMNRSLSLGCGLTNARRTPSLFSRGYVSTSSNCAAYFSMN
jgi:hypothetical protein